MPMKRDEYPVNWELISRSVRQAAGWRCELCDAQNGGKHWKTGAKVVLTVHHINGNKQDNSKVNLIALCQRCHLRLDLGRHIQNRRKKEGQEELKL